MIRAVSRLNLLGTWTTILRMLDMVRLSSPSLSNLLRGNKLLTDFDRISSASRFTGAAARAEKALEEAPDYIAATAQSTRAGAKRVRAW